MVESNRLYTRIKGLFSKPLEPMQHQRSTTGTRPKKCNAREHQIFLMKRRLCQRNTHATKATPTQRPRASNFLAKTSPQPVPDARVSLPLKPNPAILTLLSHHQTVRRLVRHTAKRLADSAEVASEQQEREEQERTNMPNSRSVIAPIHTRTR